MADTMYNGFVLYRQPVVDNNVDVDSNKKQFNQSVMLAPLERKNYWGRIERLADPRS